MSQPLHGVVQGQGQDISFSNGEVSEVYGLDATNLKQSDDIDDEMSQSLHGQSQGQNDS